MTASPEMATTATVDHHHILIPSFTEDPPPNTATTTPLLQTTTTTKTLDADDADELRRFWVSLKWCLLDHSLVSRAAFLLLAVIFPALSALTVRDPPDSDPTHFNRLVHIPSTSLAALAFLSLRHRPHLAADAAADSAHVRRRHAAELDRAFRRLALIFFPSFFVELAHKLVFLSSNAVAPANSAVFVAVSLASWVYRSGVFLLVCVVFRMTCELQILRLEEFQKMFESSSSTVEDCGVMFKEHIRIKKQLWETSHKYRFFIIGSLFVITVTQFGALLMVLGTKTEKNFFNSGDLVVCSAVEISGFFLCLVGAARITHRAQRIVSVATRWHMLVTCVSCGPPNQSKAHIQDHKPNYEDDDNDNNQHLYGRESGSDSDSSLIFTSVSPQDPSSFSTRQALIAYLEHNNGGITLFGFVLDRGSLHTLFVFEFSLVLWILSKVVVL